MALFIYPPSQVSIPGAATEATLLNVEQNTADTVTELQAANTKLDTIEANSSLDVIDQIDSTPLLDVSSSNIPASASLPLQVIASTAAETRKIISVEDIGEFIGVYVGPASSEVLECVLPLGGGEVEVRIPAGSRISLRHMKNSAITSGFISLNMLG